MPESIHNKILYHGDVQTSLGTIYNSGIIKDGPGVQPPGAMRTFGRYAVMLLLEGEGLYFDALGTRQMLSPGDMVFVFPDIAHHYGPGSQGRWSEIYVIFDGPVFDFWQTRGLLDPRRPVRRLAPVSLWLRKIEGFFDAPPSRTSPGHTHAVSRFLALLTEMLTQDTRQPSADREQEWLAQACALLGEGLNEEMDLEEPARRMGMAYDTFRKRFQQQMGQSPGRYRAGRRIAAACEMLRYTPMTNRQVAESLGFADEFCFSKRFKQIVGVAPKEFRKSQG